MKCYVYKGEHKQDHYLYLGNPVDAEDSPDLPEGLLSMLGSLTLVLEFDLEPERELPQADAKHVLSDLSNQGFYLQMPKKDMLAEEDRVFN